MHINGGDGSLSDTIMSRVEILVYKKSQVSIQINRILKLIFS